MNVRAACGASLGVKPILNGFPGIVPHALGSGRWSVLVAQWVERWTFNLVAAGSIPAEDILF